MGKYLDLFLEQRMDSSDGAELKNVLESTIEDEKKQMPGDRSVASESVHGYFWLMVHGLWFKETARSRVCPREGIYGIQVPKGAWHSVVAHEPSTIFEAKDGAYGV